VHSLYSPPYGFAGRKFYSKSVPPAIAQIPEDGCGERGTEAPENIFSAAAARTISFAQTRQDQTRLSYFGWMH
jgi:hypothetical protein